MSTLISDLSSPARRAGLVSLGLGAAALVGCVVAPYPVRGGRGPAQQDPGYDEGPVVMVGPPAQIHEIPGSPPAAGYLWIGGYWNWVGGRHAWVRGHWSPPRAGKFWAPHRWARHGPGWRMAPGGWRRR